MWIPAFSLQFIGSLDILPALMRTAGASDSLILFIQHIGLTSDESRQVDFSGLKDRRLGRDVQAWGRFPARRVVWRLSKYRCANGGSSKGISGCDGSSQVSHDLIEAIYCISNRGHSRYEPCANIA